MNKLKIIVIGDNTVDEGHYAEEAKKIKTEDDKEIVKLSWRASTKAEYQRRILNVEVNGPAAEQPAAGLEEEIMDADMVLTHTSPIPGDLIRKAKKLKLIGSCRGGIENVDVAAATEKGVPFIHCIRNAEATSDFAVGLMWSEIRNISRGNIGILNNIWKKEFPNSPYLKTMDSMTLGLVGLGHIGKLVGRKCLDLGMKIVGYDPYVSQNQLDTNVLAIEKQDRLEDVFRKADIVSVHMRASKKTENLIDKRYFSLMKPTAYFINTARAKVVNRGDLLAALQKKEIGGAALDVFWEEPIPADDPFLQLENVTLTPHIAGTVSGVVMKSPQLLVSAINSFKELGISDLVVNYKDLYKQGGQNEKKP